jgi:sulfopyruvate decarboxylase subunit beta
MARAAGISDCRLVTNIEDFAETVRNAIAAERLSCVVAKVEAVLPASFHLDVHLLENRFQFARALQSAPAPPSV